MQVNPAYGQAAIVTYRIIARRRELVWLEFYPHTGHQVLVHSAALGCSVLGNLAYGSGLNNSGHGPPAPVYPGHSGPLLSQKAIRSNSSASVHPHTAQAVSRMASIEGR